MIMMLKAWFPHEIGFQVGASGSPTSSWRSSRRTKTDKAKAVLGRGKTASLIQ